MASLLLLRVDAAWHRQHSTGSRAVEPTNGGTAAFACERHRRHSTLACIDFATMWVNAGEIDRTNRSRRSPQNALDPTSESREKTIVAPMKLKADFDELGKFG